MEEVEESIFTEESSEEYHSKSGEGEGKHLSSGLLSKFRKCPLLYQKTSKGQIEEKSSPAWDLGRWFHTLALEGVSVFEDLYTIGGPINEKTGKAYGKGTKAWDDHARTTGKEIIPKQDYELMEKMLVQLIRHPIAGQLLCDGLAERVIRREYNGISCQIRCDYVTKEDDAEYLTLIDLKTCDDLDWFEHDARRYGYLNQMAFYRRVLEMACLEVPEIFDSLPVCYFIVAEKKEPHRCGLFAIDPLALDQYRGANEKDMAKILAYREKYGENLMWPTGFEGIREINLV